MPKLVVRTKCDGETYYLEWSTIVDAPVTYGMTRAEFERYYRREYGRAGLERLPERIKNALPLREVVPLNRAGDNEACLTQREIVDKYIRQRR